MWKVVSYYAEICEVSVGKIIWYRQLGLEGKGL